MAASQPQEGRDVDLVVADLERADLPVARGLDAATAAATAHLGRTAGEHLEALESGRDDGDAELVAHRVVDDGAEDDVGALVGGAGDDLGGLVDLEEAHVLAAGDVEEHAGGAVDRRLEERRGDRLLGGLGRAALAGGVADAHQGGTGVGHDRPDVGEVEVDEAGDGDQVGDPLDALAEDVVGLAEGLADRLAALDDVEQLLVRNDDQRVDLVAELLDPVESLLHALGALELERLGDDADRERADLLLGDLGDDGGRTGSGAASLAGGDEDHVGALQRLLDVVAALGRGSGTDLGLTAGAEAAGQLLADRELDVGVAGAERLRVGVDGEELDPLESCVDHAGHRIRAAAAGADNLDHRQVTGSLHLSFTCLSLFRPELE